MLAGIWLLPSIGLEFELEVTCGLLTVNRNVVHFNSKGWNANLNSERLVKLELLLSESRSSDTA